MKQSLKTKKTIINEPVKFTEFISRQIEGARLIAHCNPGFRSNIADIYKKGENCTVLIGPEGDFSRDETEAASAAKFSSITLGPSRLRTETAGIAACHSIYFLNL
jgi:16S rRNA (uracil1498-N3)-methyltransferase